MNEFIIVFRECLEACLIVGIIYSFLSRANLKDALGKLWLGVGASILASIGVAFLVVYLKSFAGDTRFEKLFEALFMYAAAGLIWYVVFWLSKHVSDRKDLESKTEQALEMSSWGVFWVVFFSILREGFETVVMLLGQDRGDGFSYLGFVAGAALAILIGYLIVIGGKRINLKPFFQGTTLLLVFLASGMIAYGTHEAEEYLEKSGYISKADISRPWDILKPSETVPDGAILYKFDESKGVHYHPFYDKGYIGEFLKGFFGYNSNPNYVELLFWVLSLAFGLNMWRRFYFN
jgi:high-affinity iron transporter|tara:strand:- start:12259 stop:13131 length:873 start_codon:yes stop_codon:yes gene_type:complete